MIGIYGIKNLVTGKMYIGKSVEMENRFKKHLNTLKNNKHHSEYLQNSYNKHGKEVFIFGIIEHCPVEDLDKQEKYWIDYYDSYNNGYNCTIPNGINCGHIWTDENKLKLSAVMKKNSMKISLSKRREKMNNMRKLVNYENFSYRFKNKYYLYNKDTFELEYEFDYTIDCAKFLGIAANKLKTKYNKLLKEKGQGYKGFIIVKESTNKEELFNIIKERKEKLRLRSENKKDKYYTTLSEEERNISWKKNSLIGVEVRKQQLRDGGTHKIQAFKEGVFVKEYLIPSDASEDLNIPLKYIHNVLGGYKKSTRGYTFIRETEGVLI